MSRQTLARIPREVQHIFKIYETASQLYRPYDDKLVSQFVNKTGSYYEMFNRRRLVSGSTPGMPIFNRSDFPPVTRDIVARIFETPLELEPKLRTPELTPSDLDNLEYLEAPLFSDRQHTAKNFTNYQARILSSLASFYSPSKDAAGPVAQRSLTWYRRLLAQTPVIFFLCQKQRLMTESSLRGLNKPLDSFRESLDDIRTRYVTDTNPDKRIRNYHLTDLVTTDVFGLAVKEEATKDNANSGETPKLLQNIPELDDKLCARLRRLRQPQIVGSEGKICSQKALRDSRLAGKYPLARVETALKKQDDPSKVAAIFPYDILYNDIYMLTIEEPVYHDNHADLLALLEKQKDFEVFAVRISTAGALEFDLTAPEADKSAPKYEQLLRWAEKQHTHSESAGHVPSLLERIGEWGLVAVEDNASSSAFYVFKE